MRFEDMKNNIPETPDFIHEMIQNEQTASGNYNYTDSEEKEEMERCKSGSGSNGLRAGNFHSSLCGCENVPHVCGKTGRLQCEDGDNIRK